jgi:predicted dithiol-disulfide oxidoreductase (DUF899 family)
MAEADPNLTPVAELAAKGVIRYPGESEAYRAARNALLVEEIELRRKLEDVARHRRNLPEGAVVEKDYVFEGKHGDVHLADLFEGHDTLVVYCWMYGPERERPCPMCTQFLGPLAANAADLRQRVALAVVARSPAARLYDFAAERGWRDLPLFCDTTEQFGRDHGAWTDGGDWPAYQVFTEKDGIIRHFYGAELTGEMADPGQDPRGAPEMSPLWNVLDTTPAGRGTDWYPKIDYD